MIIDNPDYGWYVVTEEGIFSGNVLKKDAELDKRKYEFDFGEGSCEVLSRSSLTAGGLNPKSAKNWHWRARAKTGSRRISGPRRRNPSVLKNRWWEFQSDVAESLEKYPDLKELVPEHVLEMYNEGRIPLTDIILGIEMSVFDEAAPRNDNDPKR